MHFSKTSNAVEPPFQGLCCIIDPSVKGEFQLTQKTSYKSIMKEVKDLMYSRGFANRPLTKDGVNQLMSEIYKIGIRQKNGSPYKKPGPALKPYGFTVKCGHHKGDLPIITKAS